MLKFQELKCMRVGRDRRLPINFSGTSGATQLDTKLFTFPQHLFQAEINIKLISSSFLENFSSEITDLPPGRLNFR